MGAPEMLIAMSFLDNLCTGLSRKLDEMSRRGQL